MNIGGAPETRRAIHPSATFGDDCVVWDFARILARAALGSRVSVGGGAEVGIGTTIGDDTRISANVFIPAHARIGKNVFIGPGVIFTDDRYPRTLQPGETYVAEPPFVDDGASIGAGAVILPGIRIGSGALVGAGAIVTKDVPAHQHVRGEPARAKSLGMMPA